ncbi:IclR family transcriptional regulator [Nocardia aobensis]|uniref:IclR family transcriptional regulator n=1 Tax=Nocardia aobensis TaxID=257277 RepID=A0ABW6PF15_9NOCA
MARSTSGESVLTRIVRIVESFDADTPAITLTELARRADLPPATTSRLVKELISYGWLRRDDANRIRIGIRLWELASRASPTLGLREAAMPFMQDLHAVVGQHVQLAVMQRREVLYVERLSAPGAVRNLSRFAGRLPLQATAPGLVLLAHAPAELQAEVLTSPLTAFTPSTPVDPKALRALLGEIRRSGVAYCPGFLDETTTSIAVAVHTAGGRVPAALSVLLPNDSAAAAAVPALLAAAHGISRVLGAPVRPR